MGSQSECVTGELTEGISLLGLRFGYSYESALQLFNLLSSEALTCYAKLLRVWDNIFPFLYGSMYIAWLSILYKNVRFRNVSYKLINLFPLLPLLADLFENYFENALVSQFILFHSLSPGDVQIASVLTRIKWSLSLINYLVIIAGIALLILNKRGKKRMKNTN
ncbi:MAG: hypothetical protein AMS26_19290 [Bacteroides sp. SM23_62]|nr:MAG: hypothetical protein AMS26_19290 [Bacteroides sp. SM23_62]